MRGLSCVSRFLHFSVSLMRARGLSLHGDLLEHMPSLSLDMGSSFILASGAVRQALGSTRPDGGRAAGQQGSKAAWQQGWQDGRAFPTEEHLLTILSQPAFAYWRPPLRFPLCFFSGSFPGPHTVSGTMFISSSRQHLPATRYAEKQRAEKKKRRKQVQKRKVKKADQSSSSKRESKARRRRQQKPSTTARGTAWLLQQHR